MDKPRQRIFNLESLERIAPQARSIDELPPPDAATMTTPDTSTLTSSAQIFTSNHTLPQIKSIHKTLHVQIEDKATRLRTQVGGSYRELLGTAENIVRMRAENDDVQQLLGQMGGRCGRAVVSAKASGLAAFVAKQDKPETVDAARLKLLDRCGLTAGRILRAGAGLPESISNGDRLVLATKVYVLSRLLIKNLEGAGKSRETRQAVAVARDMLGALRRRIQRAMEKVLESDKDAAQGDDDVLKALCAYSLATNSGARDVLRRFLDIRGEAISFTFDAREGERAIVTDDVIKALKLYTRTLLEVQALTPSKLSRALLGLKKHPLIEDATLKQLEGLRLDVAQRWCGDEIEYFTPFIRHDDLDGSQAREQLMEWAKKGAEILLSGLKRTLEGMIDFKSIMELRTSVLQLWIRDGGRARGFDPHEMQDDIRKVINARMLTVLETKVKKLHLVGSEMEATLDGWRDGITDKHLGLWDEEGYDEALSTGAASLVEAVVSRLYGRNDAVSRAVNSYTTWFQVVDDVGDVIQALRKQRWDNDYDEVEDEATIEARQQLFSRKDPQYLQTRLDSSLDSAFQDLEQHLKKLWQSDSAEGHQGGLAMYLLRVIREIRSKLPERQTIAGFGLVMVPVLHNSISNHVAASVVDDFAKTSLRETETMTRPLWEGEPAVPTQPSPGLFSFLRSLSLTMADAGTDLWSPAAVKTIKALLEDKVCEAWLEVLERPKEVGATREKSDDGSAEDSDAEKAPQTEITSGPSSDLITQWVMDVAYLENCVTESRSDAKHRLSALGDKLFESTGLEADARQRIAKAAKESWRRTSLLFGLLA